MNHLQNRLILAFLAVILVTLCGVSTALLLILRNSPLENRVILYELNDQAQAFVAQLRRLPNFEPNRANFERLKTLAQRRQIPRIAWANPQGRVLFDSEGRWAETPPLDLFARLRQRPGGEWLGEVRDGSQRWLVAARPLPAAAGPRGYLVLARPAPTLHFLRRFRQTMARPLVQAGLIAFVLGVLLSALVSRSIARPLRRVADAARALAGGNLDARAPATGPSEVQELAETFNEMARRIQASQQAQRDLVANVAHDLRTPLTSIQGFAQALVDGTAATPEAQARAARAIHEESQRMQRMTNLLLDLARFEAGAITLRREPVDLAALARKRVAHFAPQAQDAGVTLTAQVTTPTTTVGDAARLEQAVDNLLGNALAHTGEGGRVLVHVDAEPAWALLAVSDTGVGIPSEDLPRIFERFYRGDKARRGTGTGLGLAIVREIARAHDGTVQAESVVGVGSKFTLRLPRAPEAG
jgi:signal transduction histidine kinase